MEEGNCMTSDKELMNKINEWSSAYGVISMSGSSAAFQSLVAIIHQREERLVREARLEELEPFTDKRITRVETLFRYAEHRIAQLTNKEEEKE